MSREYCFNLTVPLQDLSMTEELLEEARRRCVSLRVSRKTDRHGCARFYLSFPFITSRPDLSFEEWFAEFKKEDWDLVGPTHGRWGLA